MAVRRRISAAIAPATSVKGYYKIVFLDRCQSAVCSLQKPYFIYYVFERVCRRRECIARIMKSIWTEANGRCMLQCTSVVDGLVVDNMQPCSHVINKIVFLYFFGSGCDAHKIHNRERRALVLEDDIIAIAAYKNGMK